MRLLRTPALLDDDIEWRERPKYDTNLFIVAKCTGLDTILYLYDVYLSLKEHKQT